MALALILAGCNDDDETGKVALKSITINPTSVSLTAGFTQQLTATTDPSGVDVVFEWQSENPMIASVSGEGLVTAQKEGSTTVKVKGGGVEASVPVSVAAVVVPLEDITVDADELFLKVDETKEVAVTLVPANATNITVTFESGNNAVATVSAAGEITAVGLGTATITVKAGNITKTITVTVAIKDITITPASLVLEVGGKQQLVVATVPADAPGIVFEFESGDPNIATVSESGEVEAVASGSVSITVRGGGISKQVTVIVTDRDPNLPEQDQWKKLGASSEWNTSVALAIDGNPETLWHSDPAAQLPQWISVDMGAPKNIDGFLFTNRQTKTDKAHPKHVVFEISNDGTNWRTALDIAALPDLFQQQILPLPQREVARYFKLTIQSTWIDSSPYTYIGDIGIYAGQAPAPNPGPEVDQEPTGWTVEASSFFSNLTADGLIDGDINSPWHSNVGDGQPWAIIDFKEAETIYGIYFTGRQGGVNDVGSSPRHIIFSVSNNKEDWETLLEIQELPNERTMQTLNAPAPKTGRYLKINIQSTWNEAPYSYIGEIDIKTTPD